MTKSISLILMRTESLVVKLSVNLLDGKNLNAVYTTFEGDPYDYVTVNLAAYVSIQYKPKNNIPWDQSQVVKINEMSIFTLIRGLKDFYGRYQREDMFTYYKSGLIQCNATDDDRVIISFANKQNIELKPDVILDQNTNIVLPGIVMSLNISDNKVYLSSDEFEAFLYRMSQINIQAEALALVNMSMHMGVNQSNRNKLVEAKPKTVVPPHNVFKMREDKIKDDVVVDKRVIPDTPKSIDDLK